MFSIFSREQPTGLIFNDEHDNDPRNLRWEDVMPLAGAGGIPESGDNEKDSWTLNQVKTSACTCHSTVYAANQVRGKRLSPRYAFWKIKNNRKYPSSTLPHGAYMLDSIKLLVNEGICQYSFFPNKYEGSDEDYLSEAPNDLMEYDASQNKGGSYIYVTSGNDDKVKFDQIKSFLATSGGTCKVGIVWRTSFNNARKDGIVPASEPTGNAVGHDMHCVAWKTIDGHEYLGFRNSFGDTWGDKGRIWLPKGYFKIQSAIAYLAPIDSVQNGISKPEPVSVTRDYYLEKSKAQSLRNACYEKFPLNVAQGSKDANNVARELMGRMWLVLVPAVAYLGWTNTDIINYLYARSRNKKDTKAYSFDFTKHK